MTRRGRDRIRPVPREVLVHAKDLEDLHLDGDVAVDLAAGYCALAIHASKPPPRGIAACRDCVRAAEAFLQITERPHRTRRTGNRAV